MWRKRIHTLNMFVLNEANGLAIVREQVHCSHVLFRSSFPDSVHRTLRLPLVYAPYVWAHKLYPSHYSSHYYSHTSAYEPLNFAPYFFSHLTRRSLWCTYKPVFYEFFICWWVFTSWISVSGRFYWLIEYLFLTITSCSVQNFHYLTFWNYGF